MEYKTFSELTLKDLTLKNLMIIIRFILLSILFVLIYLIIWHFIYKIGNEYINFFGPIICLIIGWKRLSYYEEAITYKLHRDYEGINDLYEFEIYPLLKIILTPIAIPLMVSSYVCDFISNRIYKYNKTENKNTNKSNNNSTTYDYSDFEEEYYCEVCLKRITEEDYELYDYMCEDCFFEKEDYNNMKN